MSEQSKPGKDREIKTLSTEGRKLIGQAIIDGLISPSSMVFLSVADYSQGTGNYNQKGGDHKQGPGDYTQAPAEFNRLDLVSRLGTTIIDVARAIGPQTSKK